MTPDRPTRLPRVPPAPLLRLLATLVAGVASVGASSPPEAASDAPVALAVISAPGPIFPMAVAGEPIYYGIAWVACAVDDDGSVLETWTLRATHPAFGQAAEAALQTWRYAPRAATTAPWPRTEVVRFNFGRPGHVETFPGVVALKSVFPYLPSGNENLGELPLLPPGTLTRIKGGPPRASSATRSGRVLIEFLVDSTGRVRLPVVLEATHPDQAREAAQTVRGWNFTALPASVEAPAARVRWAFAFGPKP